MDDVVGSLLGTIFGWFAQVLPQDPFDSYFVAASGWRDGLGWLNWMFPVHDAVAFFTGWITATVGFAAGKRLVSGLLDVGTSIVKVV